MVSLGDRAAVIRDELSSNLECAVVILLKTGGTRVESRDSHTLGAVHWIRTSCASSIITFLQLAFMQESQT